MRKAEQAIHKSQGSNVITAWMLQSLDMRDPTLTIRNPQTKSGGPVQQSTEKPRKMQYMLEWYKLLQLTPVWYTILLYLNKHLSLWSIHVHKSCVSFKNFKKVNLMIYTVCATKTINIHTACSFRSCVTSVSK